MNPALPQPFDVKLMNFTATVIFAAAGVVLLAAALWWLVRNPAFSIGAITVQGDVTHTNAVTLRANVAPHLAGNFFTVSLQETRDAFQAVPWVREAVVRREFPNRLRVTLREHQAVAFWGEDSEMKLVDSFGEVFEANPGDVEQDNLPRLKGPEGQSLQVLQMYEALRPLFDPLDLSIERIALSAHGSWTAELDSGARIELGRGSQQEVLERTRRFVQTLTQVTARYNRHADSLVSADLRHGDGYAVRLRGVTTGAEAPPKK
ncbi:cell division protein FtsQ/DivIB [Caenimonas terrae]|uniref:Cell division protein FtsQ n=1 Tax=Caenimonas terrae TaxID=696074 RepID=A0ABW0NFD9_9BURK